MSAFVVDDKTINRVLGWLYGKASGESGSRWALDALAKAGFDLIAAARQPEPALARECERLGHAMHDLNVDAVRQRYGDADKSGMVPTDSYIYRNIPPGELVRVYKSLMCWEYQCSEGDVPDRPFYLAMDKVASRLAHRIVVALPAYDKAEWA